ncbi:MAG: CBS domain-containing protein [Rhodospirillales bacterium]|nr:CBS domain-containing protein [Rhodospirillales bacterium]
MQVSEVVRRKGREVYSIQETRTLAEAAQVLWQRQVGALVVKDRRGELAGIISERDIVRAIAENGPAGLEREVGAMMNPDVVTCDPQDRIERVMKLMTLHRVRHIPLREGDRLVGLVSIGDLVKHRLEEKTYEAEVLRELNVVRSG